MNARLIYCLKIDMRNDILIEQRTMIISNDSKHSSKNINSHFTNRKLTIKGISPSNTEYLSASILCEMMLKIHPKFRQERECIVIIHIEHCTA